MNRWMTRALEVRSIPTKVLMNLVLLYRRFLSPAAHALNPGGCKYLPTCSEYALIALERHGAVKGTALAAWRVLRCNPFARGGVDNVPPRRDERAA